MRTVLTAFLICHLIFCFRLPEVPAGEADEKAPMRSLHLMEARYGAARTLQARFLERYLENGRLVRAEAGNAYFLKPGKMRWDYEAPEKNTFLVDGKYVWFYSPADHTATRKPVKQSDDWRTPLAFLMLHMKLSRICARIDAMNGQSPGADGDSGFQCVLRQPGDSGGAAAASPVRFEVSRDGELKRVLVPEGAGREIEFLFTGWQWDPVLPKSEFEFAPPRGVAIVDGLLPEAPWMRQ